METNKQVSIFLENKPGRLANVLSALAKDKVNIVAMTVMDSHEHSVLRMVVDNNDKTTSRLKEMGIPHAEAEVLVVELRNQPGALAHLCEVMGSNHINIDYCYCSAGGRNGKTMGIFKVSNTEKALKALSGGIASNKKQVRPMRDQRTYSAPGNNR